MLNHMRHQFQAEAKEKYYQNASNSSLDSFMQNSPPVHSIYFILQIG